MSQKPGLCSKDVASVDTTSQCSVPPPHGPLFLHSRRRRCRLRRPSCDNEPHHDDDVGDGDGSVGSNESECEEWHDERHCRDLEECWAEIARLKKKLGELSRKVVAGLEDKVDKPVYNTRVDKENVFFKTFGNAIHLCDADGVEFDYEMLGVTITEGDEPATIRA